MEEKTIVWIPINLHNKLKHKAVDKRSTIKKELIEILEREFKMNKNKANKKAEEISVDI